MLKRILPVLFALVVFVAATYIGDVVVLQFRKNPTSVVTVHPYTAVPRKDKREELMFDDPYDETCINSLFPHQQMPPCWYLKQHTEKRTSL
jgi:hypothetical protein